MYFNHETQAFLPGPSLLEGRMNHASATIIDRVTKAKTPIVAGGVTNAGEFIDSTELLINGEWQLGKICENKPESFQPSKASQTFQYFEK